MTRGQVVADQLVHAAVPVVVGIVVGRRPAHAASGLFPRGFVLHVEPDPGRRFDALVLLPIALAVAVALLCWVLVAVAASEDERPGAARAVLGRGGEAPAGAGGDGPPLRVRPPGPRLDEAEGCFRGHGGHRRRPGRALTFGASLDGLVEAGLLGRGLRPPRQGGGELPDAVRAELENDPDVAGASLFGAVVATAGTEGFDVAGVLPVVGSTEPHFFEGRLPMGEDEIVVGRAAARRLGVGVGDELVVTSLRATDAAGYGDRGVSADRGRRRCGRGRVVTFDGLRRLDPSAVTSAAGVRLRGGRDTRRRRAADAEEHGDDRRAVRPAVRDVNVAPPARCPTSSPGSSSSSRLLNLAHHLILSARRRRRDLAVLRALGADGRWVTGVVHWQASLFTIAAVALGVPFGIAAGRITYRTFVDRIGAVESVTLPLATFAGSWRSSPWPTWWRRPAPAGLAGHRPRASSPASEPGRRVRPAAGSPAAGRRRPAGGATAPIGTRVASSGGGAPLAKRPVRSVSPKPRPVLRSFRQVNDPETRTDGHDFPPRSAPPRPLRRWPRDRRAGACGGDDDDTAGEATEDEAAAASRPTRPAASWPPTARPS